MTQRLYVLAILILLSATQAQAQSFVSNAFNNAVEAVQQGLELIWPDNVDPDEVNARLGLGLGFTPDYNGSDNYRFRLVPLIDIRYKEDWRLNGSRLTFGALKSGNFETGPLLALRFGRPEKRNEVLEGLGDISTTFEVGVYSQYQTPAALLALEYRHGLGAGIGSSLRLTAGHGIYKKDNFVAMLIARAKWLSDKSMKTNFGISPEQSTNSTHGLPTYIPDSGVSEVSLNMVGAWTLNERVRLFGLVSYGHLLGDADNSPIVTVSGNGSQFVAGTGVALNF